MADDSPFAYPGHYVVDGECVACGRKPDNLEYYGPSSAAAWLERELQRARDIPPVWTEEMIQNVPKAIQGMLRRYER